MGDNSLIEYRWAFEVIWSEEFAGEEEEKNILMILSALIRKDKLPVQKYYIQTNQNRDELYYYACTIHSTFWAIADLFTLTRESYETYIYEIVQYMLEKWWYDTHGWAFTANAAKASEYIWNLHNPTRKVKLIVTELWTTLYHTLNSFGYSFAVTYISGTDYSLDASDWRLDNTTFKNSKWGHSIRFKNLEKTGARIKPNDITALDNYLTKDKKDYKRYLIARQNIALLKNSSDNQEWKFFPRCYTFLPLELGF